MRKYTLSFLTTALIGIGFTAQAAELIMVEEPGCAWCAKWENELGEIYPKTSEGKYAPLRKVELSDLKRKDGPEVLGVMPTTPVVFTPTFLLVDDGKEIARLQGYPGEDFFWGLLEQMLIEHTDYVAPSLDQGS
ncbi:hypothetical protein SAMN04488030_1123 [Aliiroseovarius halocynthiae]|uniref:Thioredoxin family protein n=1 Tax=Aliiroseovarius halocynthiae TaxID=985055 RepID=A0A545SVP5_9RHOB|nr:hypothetical protein [Aliiroseovarius halocynthiae]TQV69037.1 hypothetical protein FIL88_05565 [Aliiroseovarius halocynthiae]SMR71789.1 hypothetical protein SAMN04488030_1123 [Aliiroseovarius halocynthiae]